MKKSLKNTKNSKFPDYDLVKIPSHMVDSIWTKKDMSEILIYFATGYILKFTPKLK